MTISLKDPPDLQGIGLLDKNVDNAEADTYKTKTTYQQASTYILSV